MQPIEDKVINWLGDMCSTCGAIVPNNARTLHTKWHSSLAGTLNGLRNATINLARAIRILARIE